MKNYLLLFTCILLSNCGSDPDVITGINEEIKIIDVLNNEQYSKLYKDEAYTNFISDWWENHLDIYEEVHHGTELIGMSNIMNLESEDLKTKASAVFSAIGTIGSVSVDGLQGTLMDDEKKDLYKTFSNEKIALANKFETELMEVLHKSNTEYTNQKVKENDLLLNYKSFKSVLRLDEELIDELDLLTDEVDDLFSLGFLIRTKMYLNVKLNPNQKYDFREMTAKALNDKEYLPTCDASSLNDYFKKLKEVRLMIDNIQSKKFATPVEDWSKDKKENFDFVISDIKLKIDQEVASMATK